MSRKDALTLRFCALMLASIAVELSVLVMVDSPSPVALTFLLADLLAIVGFFVAFVQEDTKEQAAARADERRRNGDV